MIQRLANLETKYLNLLIIIVAAFIFIPFLGHVHLFDWDEINFAEAAREMILTKDYFRMYINFEPFWEKPPFFIWLQVLSFKVFGVGGYGARFPNAIAGIITLLVVFNIGKKLYNKKFGLIWALIFLGSFLPHFFFKTGIIDPIFNLFIFLGLYYLYQTNTEANFFKTILSGVFIGLAILTKGPVALLVLLLCAVVYFIIYWINRKSKTIHFPVLTHIFLFFMVVAMVSFIWFGYETIKNGFWFIQEFIEYQIVLLRTSGAGHGGPFYYHPIVLLIGCFPASIFVFKAFAKQDFDTYKQHDFKRWMIILFWVVLILFSIVKTKIVHYSSLTYFPITFLAAYFVYYLLEGKMQWNKYLTWGIAIIGSILSLVMIILPIIGKYKSHFLFLFEKDKFAMANIQADVYWSGWEIIVGLLFLVLLIYAIKLIKRMEYEKGVLLLLFATLFCFQVFLFWIAPKIEGYSQNAAIEFYESKQNEVCNINVMGYKSYAHLFYARKQPAFNEANVKQYYVTRVDRLDRVDVSNLKELYRKNGFVFYEDID